MSDAHPREVLREARQLVKSQEYAAALEKYIWFHNHALDYDRALAGVRLSYAIFEWVDLGERYPPARKALEAVRDAKTDTLVQGACDAILFHDVAAINRALRQVERTRDLFKAIAIADRAAGERCVGIVLEDLILTKEFRLARSFITEPRKQIDRDAVPLNSALQRKVSDPELLEDTLVTIYSKRVNLILQAFIGVGEDHEADLLRNYALERIAEPHLRDRVMDRLYASPPSKRPQ